MFKLHQGHAKQGQRRDKKTTQVATPDARENTPEHMIWKQHRDLVRKVHDYRSVRDCTGLALVPKTLDSMESVGERQLLRDSDVEWATLTDVPPGGLGRMSEYPMHWATIRPTAIRHSMPCLAVGTEKHVWNFRNIPATGPSAKLASRYILDPLSHSRYFRVFNSLEWAMTSTAFTYREMWKRSPARTEFLSVIGAESQETALLIGDKLYSTHPDPCDWMPDAYLAFPRKLHTQIFELVSRQVLRDGQAIVYNQRLCDAFMDALGSCLEYKAPFAGRIVNLSRGLHHGDAVLNLVLEETTSHANVRHVDERTARRETIRLYGPTAAAHVKLGDTFNIGDVLAEELLDADVPQDWHELSYRRRWNYYVPQLLSNRLDVVMRLWFERQAVFTSDEKLVHFPARIASLAAEAHAVDSGLLWDVQPSFEFFSDASEAFIFPPLPIRGRWNALRGVLPGGIAYDLSPKSGDTTAQAIANDSRRARRAGKWAKKSTTV